MSTNQAYVNYEVQDSIGTITFFHPAHNSLPGDILAKLASTIKKASDDTACKVIILKSGGDRTFCAGASFDELISIENKTQGKAFFMGFANVINACRSCKKLIIGRVQGKAVGGGVGVASAVDYCYATKYASVKLSELAIGIGPFVVGPAVERKLGCSAFSQMAMQSKKWYSSEWAHHYGLFAEVFDSTEAMDEAINAFAKELSQMNPAAMKLLKEAFWKGTDEWNTLLEERAAMSGELVLSDFTRNAIEKFKQK